MVSQPLITTLHIQHMKATENVYAAGDIVRFPLPLVNGDVNIGHWQIAHNHGVLPICLGIMILLALGATLAV